MKVKTGLTTTGGRRPPFWYWVPRAGMLFQRPYFVWLNRFWWLWETRDEV